MSIDTNSIQFCPVLRPTMKQFKNFESYIESVQKRYENDFGLVKVIPPKEWKPRKQNYSQADVQNLILKSPIEQNIYGKDGIYELLLLQKKSLSVQEYKNRVITLDKITQNLSLEDIEKLFWKNISFSPPLYGADVPGSVMDSNVPWALNNLKTCLNVGLNNINLQGINQPYIYAGCWKSMFGWHTEDYDLYSINFLHYGKPKFWYSLPENQFQEFRDHCKKVFPDGFSKCPEFLRHKTILINPYSLISKGFKFNFSKMVQNPGEFIVTFNKTFHAGFNLGYNLAEAVNFATPLWLKSFQDAQVCKCNRDSVTIDKLAFFENLIKSKYNNNRQILKFYQQQKQNTSPEVQKTNRSLKSLSTSIERESPFKKPNTIIKKQIQKLKDQKKSQFWIQCDKCKIWVKLLKKEYSKFSKLQQFYCQKHLKKNNTSTIIA